MSTNWKKGIALPCLCLVSIISIPAWIWNQNVSPNILNVDEATGLDMPSNENSRKLFLTHRSENFYIDDSVDVSVIDVDNTTSNNINPKIAELEGKINNFKAQKKNVETRISNYEKLLSTERTKLSNVMDIANNSLTQLNNWKTTFNNHQQKVQKHNTQLQKQKNLVDTANNNLLMMQNGQRVNDKTRQKYYQNLLEDLTPRYDALNLESEKLIVRNDQIRIGMNRKQSDYDKKILKVDQQNKKLENISEKLDQNKVFNLTLDAKIQALEKQLAALKKI